jgi:hypothetical protein
MAGGRAGDDDDTATRILDSAESLVQVRGFNGFSYADVAGELSDVLIRGRDDEAAAERLLAGFAETP